MTVTATVGPADAGMFRASSSAGTSPRRRPRGRGDVPRFGPDPHNWALSAPRTRGCSADHGSEQHVHDVGPADAGMFPRPGGGTGTGTGRPRGRGDVPLYRLFNTPLAPSAPRTRGCSRPAPAPARPAAVGPADAGMFRGERIAAGERVSRPRGRGDVPCSTWSGRCSPTSAPRTRGCSGHGRAVLRPGHVGPADAGMFPTCWARPSAGSRRPRGRGDVPAAGCLPVRHARIGPADAGMFRVTIRPWPRRIGRPRGRGDVPTTSTPPRPPSRSAPRTRGCSLVAVVGGE